MAPLEVVFLLFMFSLCITGVIVFGEVTIERMLGRANELRSLRKECRRLRADLHTVTREYQQITCLDFDLHEPGQGCARCGMVPGEAS